MSRVARARRKGTSRVGARVTAKAENFADSEYLKEGETLRSRDPFTLEPPILEFQDRRMLRGKRKHAKTSTWSPFQMNEEELARFNRLPVVLPPSPPGSPTIPRRPAGNAKAQAHVGQAVLVDMDDGMGFTRGTIRTLGSAGAVITMDSSGKINMVPYTMQQLVESPDAASALSEKVHVGEKSAQGSLSLRDRANNHEKQRESSIVRGLGVGNRTPLAQ